MKRKIIYSALACGLAITLGGAALASSADESLISRSYLEGTFLQELTQEIGDWVDVAFSPIYEDAQDELDRIGQGYLSSLDSPAVPIPEGWSCSDQFVAQTGRAGDTVTLKPGSGIYWNSGSASASGVLVDVTDGEEVRAGGPLESGHRYLAAEDPVTITVSSQQAGWSVEGIWSATAEQEPPGPVDEPLPFTDVSENDWYYDNVRYVYENHLFQGISDTQFSPKDSMDRGMMTTVLYRLAGEPDVEYSPVFTDIPDGLWYTAGTVWAGKNGIVTGVGDGRFDPDSSVTRQQIAVILYNYARYVNADTSARGDLSGYADESQVASWARDAVSWAVAEGIIKGSDNRLTPGASATRAEVAAMLQRFAQWL